MTENFSDSILITNGLVLYCFGAIISGIKKLEPVNNRNKMISEREYYKIVVKNMAMFKKMVKNKSKLLFKQ